MLILTQENKEELLKDIDKTLMKAAVGEDLMHAIETLVTELKTNGIWGEPLTTEQIINILEFNLKDYKESVESVDTVK